MNRFSALINGASIGAGLMYFYDPVQGNRRRALVRDQLNSALHKINDATDTTVRDLQNRLTGVVAELQSCATGAGADADDRVIASRVRSKLGRYVSHPAAIEVTAHDGTITLRGPILTHEVDDLICAVKSVRGVQDVEDQLELHESAENISALQGGRSRMGEPYEWMQTNWSPTMRLAAGAAGAILLVNCVTRRTIPAIIFGAAGAALFTRSMTNTQLDQLLPATDGQERQQQPLPPARSQQSNPPEVQELSEGSPRAHVEGQASQA